MMLKSKHLIRLKSNVKKTIVNRQANSTVFKCTNIEQTNDLPTPISFSINRTYFKIAFIVTLSKFYVVPATRRFYLRKATNYARSMVLITFAKIVF